MSRGPRGPRKRGAKHVAKPIASELLAYEDEDIDLRDTPEYKRRQLIIRIGTTILLFAFITTSGITCVGTAMSGSAGSPQSTATPGQPVDQVSGEIAALEAQVKKDPGNAQVRSSLGAYLMQRAQVGKDRAGDLAKAAEQFEAIIANEPGNFQVLGLLGQVYIFQKNAEKANQTLNQVLKITSQPIDPKAVDKDAQLASRQSAQEMAYLGLGKLSYDKNDLDGALKNVDAAIKLNPGNGKSYLLRAGIQIDRKQPEAARQDFQFGLDIAQRLPAGEEQQTLMMACLAGIKQLSPKVTPTPGASSTPTPPILSLPSAAPLNATSVNATP